MWLTATCVVAVAEGRVPAVARVAPDRAGPLVRLAGARVRPLAAAS